MAGNKLELSLEQERFLTAMRVLFDELGKFGYGKDKEPDLNKRLDHFVDAFLEITSYTLLGKNYVQAALAFESPGGNEFSVIRTSHGASSLIELTLPIESPKQDARTNGELSLNTLKIIYVPNWKWRGGILLGAESEATQLFPIDLAPVSGLKNFRTILILPIDIYQERNKKRLYGKLMYLSYSKGSFLPEEMFMARCFANILSQVFAMAELEASKLKHKDIEEIHVNENKEECTS